MTKEASEYFADGNLFLSAEPDERLIPVVAAQLGNRLRSCTPPTTRTPTASSRTRSSRVNERDDLPDGLLPKLLARQRRPLLRLDRSLRRRRWTSARSHPPSAPRSPASGSADQLTDATIAELIDGLPRALRARLPRSAPGARPASRRSRGAGARRYVVAYLAAHAVAGFPAILRVTNMGKAGTLTENWHYDSAYFDDPPPIAILAAQDLPGSRRRHDVGEPVRSRSRRCRRRCRHCFTPLRAAFTGTMPDDEGVRHDVVTYHPVVRTHPATGRPAARRRADRVGAALRGHDRRGEPWPAEFLYHHAARPEFVYRHSWGDGDVVMWDNRCLLHYAVHDHGDATRLMHRVTVVDPYDERDRGMTARLTALVGATLIDGRGGPPLDDAVVTIRGDRIESVGRVPRDRTRTRRGRGRCHRPVPVAGPDRRPRPLLRVDGRAVPRPRRHHGEGRRQRHRLDRVRRETRSSPAAPTGRGSSSPATGSTSRRRARDHFIGIESERHGAAGRPHPPRGRSDGDQDPRDDAGRGAAPDRRRGPLARNEGDRPPAGDARHATPPRPASTDSSTPAASCSRRSTLAQDRPRHARGAATSTPSTSPSASRTR